MLQASDIYQRLAQPQDIALAFDTNILVSSRRFFKLCEQAQQINKALGHSAQIRLYVPAAAHAERLFDLAQSKSDEYDLTYVYDRLTDYGIMISDFTQADAEHCAELLGQRYQTPRQWHAFKKGRCLSCLGLPTNDEVAGTGQRCGAPIDWLIVAQASCREMILVTEDTGPEFDGLQNRAPFAEVQEALQQISKALSAG